MSDDARQDGGTEQGRLPRQAWPAAAPRRESPPPPVPGDTDADQDGSPAAESPPPDSPAPQPPAPDSRSTPPSTWMPPVSQETLYASSSTLPKTFESPFAPPVYPAPAEPASAPPVAAPVSAAPAADPSVEAADPAVPASVPPAPSTVPPWMNPEFRTESSHWAPSPSTPVSSPPRPSPPAWDRSQEPTSADPYATIGDSGMLRSPGEPRTSRITSGLVIGLVVAVLVGVGAYFLGTATGGKPAAAPSPAPSPSLPLFEAKQKELNQAKFSGDLVPLARPWLPYLGACIANTEPGGPKLKPNEFGHVFCLLGGGIQVHFAQYKSEAAANDERVLRVQLNQTTDSMAPGQQVPSLKTGAVSHVQGAYVEYAIKASDGRPLCGIWWNPEHSSAAVYLLALCHEMLGGDWAPLRDLWQRYT